MEADPADPARVVGFDVEIAQLHRRGTRPHAALRPGRLHQPRRVGRARRLRHRPERHRGQPRAPRAPGGHDSVLRVSRDSDRSRGRSRSLPRARRSARPPRGHARRHARLRPAGRGAGRIRRSFRSPTKTTCTRTATWRWAAWTPWCSTMSSPSAACAATPVWSIRPADLGVGHYVGVLAPVRRGSARSHRRHPPAGHARRAARGDLPALGDVERTTSRGCMRVCLPATDTAPTSAAPPQHRLALGGHAAVPSRVAACGGPSRWCSRASSMALAVAFGVADRERPRLRRPRRCRWC